FSGSARGRHGLLAQIQSPSYPHAGRTPCEPQSGSARDCPARPRSLAKTPRGGPETRLNLIAPMHGGDAEREVAETHILEPCPPNEGGQCRLLGKGRVVFGKIGVGFHIARHFLP